MTLGADKAYDTRDFVSILRQMNVRPHVAQNVSAPAGARLTDAHPACRLYDQPAQKAADRKGVRVDEADRRNAQDQVPRAVESGLAIPHDGSGVQPLETAEAQCYSLCRATRHHMIDSCCRGGAPAPFSCYAEVLWSE